VTLGRDVRAELPGGSFVEGVAVDVDADGSLVIETAAGRRTVSAGDVVHLR
jgi:BirA family biotin operon repressor/biotin-[acetyl-CoA-carboxylase] ligase